MMIYREKIRPSILKRIPHVGKAIAVVLIIVLFASSLAQAYVGGLQTITSSSKLKQTPDIAYNQNTDTYLVVWREKYSDSDWDIKGKILDFNGNSSPVITIDNNTWNASNPKVAASENGSDWIVTWETISYDISAQGIKAARISSNGYVQNDWWVSDVRALASSRIKNPDIGVDIVTGNFLIVWEEIDSWLLNIEYINGRLLSASVGPLDEPFTILDSSIISPFPRKNPSVNQRGYAFFVVAEKEYASSTQLEGRFVRADGSMPDDSFAIYSSGENRAPDVAAAQNFDDAFTYVVTWQREYTANVWDIYYAICGQTSCSNTGAVANSSNLEFNPSVSFTGIPGEYVVSYGKVPAGDWNGNWDIHLKSLRDDGTLGNEWILIDTSTGEGSSAGSTMGGATGDVILTWDRFSGTVPDNKLYARRYSFYPPPGAFSKSSPANGAPEQPTNPTLSWDSSSGAVSYEYCYDTTNDSSCDGSWTTTGSNRSVGLSGLINGTTYYWQARARNAAGPPTEANSGIWWSFTTQAGLPGAFSKSLPADGAPTQPTNPTLSWGSSSGAASYEYCYDTTNNNSCDESWTTTGSSRSVSLSGLSSSTTYYWQARARNPAGPTEANSGTWWSFTTQVGLPGGFGKSLPPDEETNQPINLTLSWSSSSGATSYEYCYDATNDDACDGTWTSTGSIRTVDISGLSNGTTYYWQVRARNAVGTTYADSETWWSFTIEGVPGAFSKILPIDGAPAQPTNPTLDWSGSRDATSYEYCYDTTNDDSCDGIWTDTGSMISSVGLSGLIEGTIYYWQVRAQNAIGSTYADNNGPWWSFTVAPSPTATITAIKDIYAVDGVGWGDPNQNYNGQDKMGAGIDSLTTMKSVIQFDLSSLPSNATILDANVQLRVMSRTSSEPVPVVTAYQVTSSWGESTLTWNNFPTFNASPVVAEPIDSMTTVLGLTSLAQTWLDNPSQNLGIMLQRTSGTGYVYWYTREFTSNPDWQPHLIVIYSVPGLCESVTEIPTTECEALVAFYDSTDGDNWTDNTGWLATTTPCGWYGVTCSGGQVTKLELMSNQLNGSIPPQIVNLTALEELWLKDDRLVDDLEELGSLANLTHLSIIYSQIGGPIPLELSGLSNLVHLDLHGNQLSGEIPQELANLISLNLLWLGENQLTGDIPAELGSLINLEQLWLWGNQFSGNIPPQLGDLSNLLVLELGMNKLTGGIPSEIGNLTNLVVLGLSSNALNGEVPASIVNLASLAEWFPIGAPNFGYNMLKTTDPAVVAFLDEKDPDWADTQNVAPGDVQVINSTSISIELSWKPIIYTGDGGYYEVSYSTSPGGLYTVHGTTADKTAAGYTVDGLNPGTSYYFVVETFTPSHGDQQNELWSSYSQEISAATLPGGYMVYLPLVLK